MRIPIIVLASLGAVLGACGGEPTTTFGPPNGIVGRLPPTAPTSSTTGGSGGSSGASMPPPSGSSSGGGTSSSGGGGSSSGSGSGSGGGGSGTSGGAGADGGPWPGGDDASAPSGGDAGSVTPSCAVSWSNDVYPLFQASGRGQCASSQCHGGGSSPAIAASDPAGTYATLTTFQLNGGLYIAPGDTNPADSMIECNLSITQPACGALPMPASPGAVTGADKQTIDTWIRCGAPQN